MSQTMDLLAEIRRRREVEASERSALTARQAAGVKVVDAPARLGMPARERASTPPDVHERNRDTRRAIEAATWGVVGRATKPAMHVVRPGSGWSVRQTKVHFSHG